MHREPTEGHVLAPTLFDTTDRSIRRGQGPPTATGDPPIGFVGVDGGLRPQLGQQFKEGTLVASSATRGILVKPPVVIRNPQYTKRLHVIGSQIKLICGGIRKDQKYWNNYCIDRGISVQLSIALSPRATSSAGVHNGWAEEGKDPQRGKIRSTFFPPNCAIACCNRRRIRGRRRSPGSLPCDGGTLGAVEWIGVITLSTSTPTGTEKAT